MADCVLSNGREIVIDLTKITIKQHRALFDSKTKVDEDDTALGNTVGMTGDEVGSLSVWDYKTLYAAYLKKAREPLDNPNSVGGSTSA